MKTKLTDNYPENIEFEINRAGVKSYTLHVVRVKCMVFLVFVFFLAVTIPLFESYCALVSGVPVWFSWMILLAMSLLGGMICWWLTYSARWIWGGYATCVSENYKIGVKGAFLSIETGTGRSNESRLIHFRSIVDYTHHDLPRYRKHGIEALSMETTGGHPNAQRLVLIGLKNSQMVRDQLAEIDACRESA